MTPEPPADLIELRRRFVAAEAEHTRLCRDATAEQDRDPAYQARVTEAFNASAELAAAIADHRWWQTVPNRVDAEPVLRAAARAGS